MPSPHTKPLRRAVRWLLPAAALALAPKCLLCVLAYTGLATALGLVGPELCGPPASPHPGTTFLAFLGVICGSGYILAIARRKFLHR
ncbi:MAG: hypothetical protein JSS11_00920 [Verrucomicrobia bacterium]|nr:hypothetical protein [Verrucomicrobiota bacterium]